MPVSPDALASLMRAVQTRVRLVFMNACYSGHQAAAIGDEIDFVVGMSHSVSDAAAIQFAGAFYSALGFGRTITECFEIARNSLLLNGINESDTPKLLARTGASPGFGTIGEQVVGDVDQEPERPLVMVDKAETQEVFRYRSMRDGDHLYIEPNDPYLNIVRSSAELVELSFWYSPWRQKFALPAIDIKLVNNSDRTVFFHRAVFVIKKSTPDLRPIPVFWAQSYDGNLAFGNLGWGNMQNAKLRFGLAESRDAQVDKKYEMPLDGEASAGYLTYDIANFVNGPELDYNYAEDIAYVIGDLEYDYSEADGGLVHEMHPVRVAVRLGRMRYGLPRPPSYYYDVTLPASGVDYEVELPISHSLIAGEADRFQISIASAAAARHELKIQLHYDEGQVVETSWITLDVFLSQSEAGRLWLRPAGDGDAQGPVNPPAR